MRVGVKYRLDGVEHSVCGERVLVDHSPNSHRQKQMCLMRLKWKITIYLTDNVGIQRTIPALQIVALQ